MQLSELLTKIAEFESGELQTYCLPLLKAVGRSLTKDDEVTPRKLTTHAHIVM